MSTLQSFHEARKARLARFAMAAERHRMPKTVVMPAAQQVETDETHRRREYETIKRAGAYMPLTQRILRAIAHEFGMTLAELTGPSHKPVHTIPRFFAVGMFLEMTEISLPAIGRQLGGRDHTTIMNARKRFEVLIASEAVRNRFDQIKREVKGV